MQKDLKKYAVRILHDASEVMQEIVQVVSANNIKEAEKWCYYNQYKIHESLKQIKEAEHYLRHEVP